MKPVESRSDYSAVEGFLTRLNSANMSKLVEEKPADLAKYGLDKPAMTVTIGAGSAKTVLEVGKTENDQTYAKDASRPMVFTVDTHAAGRSEQELRRLSQEGAVRVPAVLSREAARGARLTGRRQDLRVREGAAGQAGRCRDVEGHARRRIQPYCRSGGDGRSAQQAGGDQGRVVRRPATPRPVSTSRRWW